MAGLQKKYIKAAGKGGFKKAWKLQRAAKRKRRSPKKSSSTKPKRRRKTMARRKKSRSNKRGSAKLLGNNAVKAALGGALYGLARDPVNEFVKKALPGQLGNVSDEVVLLAASALAAAKGTKLVKAAGYAGLAIEAHNMARNFNLAGVLDGPGGEPALNTQNTI